RKARVVVVPGGLCRPPHPRVKYFLARREKRARRTPADTTSPAEQREFAASTGLEASTGPQSNQSSFSRGTPPKSLRASAVSDAGQRRTVRQCLVQPVTENPPDRMLERTSRGRRRSWMTPTSKLASMSRTRLRRNAIQKG